MKHRGDSSGGSVRTCRALLLAGALLVGCGGSSQDEAITATAASHVSSSVGGNDRSPQARHFGSLEQAVNFIEERTHIKASVPSALPETSNSTVRLGPGHEAQLDVQPKGAHPITIQYGIAGFDGCELPTLTAVKVGEWPALLGTSELSGRHGVFSAVIWPATKHSTQGRYGISGAYSANRMLSYARSMNLGGGGQSESPAGC